MQFFYGKNDIYIDITDKVNHYFTKNNKVTIIGDDIQRFIMFGIDPLPFIEKNIKIIYNDNEIIFNSDENIIDFTTNEFDKIYNPHDSYINKKLYLINEHEDKLDRIHNILKIKYGDFTLELPEQLMISKFLPKDRKVLELGSNIGRNSLIISTILSSSKNLVTLECNPFIFKQLEENRILNNFEFYSVNCALSKRKLSLIDWKTTPNNNCSDDINIIDYQTLKNIYKINFDTLVADCEGALFYILQDMPELLDDITMIFVENDYFNRNEKDYVLNRFIERGFKCIYTEDGIYNNMIFEKDFYQVWIR